MILIDSIYINQSGGKILLEYFIDSIFEKKIDKDFFFLFDVRFKSSRFLILNEQQYKIIVPSEKNRKKFYNEMSAKFDSIFCFANVPPPINIPFTDIYIFFQNALLLEYRGMNYSLIEGIKFFFKRQYIKFKSRKNYIWIVQTAEIKRTLVEKMGINPKMVNAMPFFRDNIYTKANHQLPQNINRILYVADGVNQKNHYILLKAWEIICNTTDLKLELNLTIPEKFTKLCEYICRLNKNGCIIINNGFCNTSELKNLYSRCNYFIFPSLSESFGLPLIEAASAGCEIIASDLPYVYEVVKPLRIFNPKNVVSIVDAIKYVMQNSDERGTEIRIVNEIDNIFKLIMK